MYELDTTTAPTAWTFKEKSSINRSLSAVARAYANAYNSELKWRLMEDCADSHYKYFQKKITPLKAFLTIHGGPITFRRFGNDPDYWGEGYSRNEIYIYSEAEFDNKRFIVHEVGHTFENALDDVLRSGKLGRDGLTEDLWLRAYEGEDFGGFKSGRGSSQFSTDYGVWDDGGTPAVWNEETKKYDFAEDDHKDGRGEIFADMFIGWVYNEWETRVDGTWTTKGQERADYIARNMGDWIYRMIEKVKGE